MDIYTGELVACKSIPLKYMNKDKIEVCLYRFLYSLDWDKGSSSPEPLTHS